MTVNVDYVSPYQRRVNLVSGVLKKHSKLSEKSSAELAEHVLEALDHIPENVR
jgi:uncharacterized protein DUF6307